MRTYALEMMLSTLMLTCGIALMWPGDTFLLPHYVVMKGYLPEAGGGGFLFGVGLVRIAAIFRNGSSRYSPLWRIGGCCVGGGFWLTLAASLELALLTAIPPEIGPPLLLAVAATAFVFEIYAGLRGGADANHYDSLGLRQARSKAGGAGG